MAVPRPWWYQTPLSDDPTVRRDRLMVSSVRVQGWLNRSPVTWFGALFWKRNFQGVLSSFILTCFTCKVFAMLPQMSESASGQQTRTYLCWISSLGFWKISNEKREFCGDWKDYIVVSRFLMFSIGRKPQFFPLPRRHSTNCVDFFNYRPTAPVRPLSAHGYRAGDGVFRGSRKQAGRTYSRGGGAQTYFRHGAHERLERWVSHWECNTS